MENILELHQISKTFPKSNFTLENLSLSLPYGAIMGFVGENGAGKTTTIGCILNTLRRDGGTVKLFGQEMQDVDTDLREKIGVVYDGDNFPGFWNARQLSRVMSGLYRQWDNALFQKYLEDFRLPVKQKIKSYSRGMTMKLAIAAALSHHPQLLILDEATSGLDPVVRDEMLDIFLTFIQQENHSIFCRPTSQAIWKKWRTILLLFITAGLSPLFPKTTLFIVMPFYAVRKASFLHSIPATFSPSANGIIRSMYWSLTAKKHSGNTKILWQITFPSMK